MNIEPPNTEVSSHRLRWSLLRIPTVTPKTMDNVESNNDKTIKLISLIFVESLVIINFECVV
jgi:hypothetical protein